MKRLIIGLLGFTLGFTAMAQEDKYIEANEYLMVYRTEINGGNKDVAVNNLLRAKNSIDAAAQHENSGSKSKTWKRKFDVYLAILTDTSKDARIAVLKKDAIDACIEADNKARTVEVDKKGNPKIHEKDQLNLMTSVLRASLFNGAIELNKQGAKGFAGHFFGKAYELGKNSATIDTSAAMNAFISYYNAAGDSSQYWEKAVEWGNELLGLRLKNADDIPLYNMIAYSKRAVGDNLGAIEVYNYGRKMFPTEASFITSLFNVYTELGEKEKAAAALNDAIEMYKDDPKMLSVLYFNMGTINQTDGKIEEAKELYEKAIAADPENPNAYNNLATIYLNEANPMINEMNNLPLNEQKKYKELKEKAKVLYKKAAELLEIVYEKDANKSTTLKSTLYDLYNFIDDPEKIKLYE